MRFPYLLFKYSKYYQIVLNDPMGVFKKYLSAVSYNLWLTQPVTIV